MNLVSLGLTNTTEFTPGKLYRIYSLSGIYALSEELLFKPGPGKTRGTLHIEKDKYFIFVETVQKGINEYSKILVDDKVLITYNTYALRGFAVRAHDANLLDSTP